MVEVTWLRPPKGYILDKITWLTSLGWRSCLKSHWRSSRNHLEASGRPLGARGVLEDKCAKTTKVFCRRCPKRQICTKKSQSEHHQVHSLSTKVVQRFWDRIRQVSPPHTRLSEPQQLRAVWGNMGPHGRFWGLSWCNGHRQHLDMEHGQRTS